MAPALEPARRELARREGSRSRRPGRAATAHERARDARGTAATEAAGGVAADFLVFGSQHGDVTSLRAMLDDIAAGTELSPTVFSQSVHNASAGLYTIISRSSAPVCALSSGASTFAAAWLEAEGFLAEHAEASVLLASYDEALPPEYASYSSQRVCAYALGLLVRSAHTGGVELEPAPAERDEPLPMAPLFIAWLLSGERSLRIPRTGEAGSGGARALDAEHPPDTRKWAILPCFAERRGVAYRREFLGLGKGASTYMDSLEQELKQLLIEALNLEDISAEEIDSTKPLFGEGLGLDSIDALELGVAIRRKYKVKMDAEPATMRQHFASIANLARFVEGARDSA